jgi:hypothetical protein
LVPCVAAAFGGVVVAGAFAAGAGCCIRALKRYHELRWPHPQKTLSKRTLRSLPFARRRREGLEGVLLLFCLWLSFLKKQNQKPPPQPSLRCAQGRVKCCRARHDVVET